MAAALSCRNIVSSCFASTAAVAGSDGMELSCIEASFPKGVSFSSSSVKSCFWGDKQRLSPHRRTSRICPASKLRSPPRARTVGARAAMLQAAPLPMRSRELKNSTPVEEIQKLRLITALKTPYLPDGRCDLEAFDNLVHMQIENGAEGLIVGGTTGEGQLMTWDEHVMLIAHTVNCFGDRIKVVGNTGSNCTSEALRATEQGFAVGMHASLQINPYYGKTSLDGLRMHFKSIIPMGPTIIYNVPGRTSQDVPPVVIEELALLPNFAGVKECTGNARIKHYTDKGLTIWSGNDDEAHDARWEHGARGVISVLSNLVPGLVRSMLYDGPNSELAAKLLPLAKWLFVEPNPIGINTALAMLGLIRPVFRLPYTPLGLEKREEFMRIVEAIGIEHFVGVKDVRLLQDDDFLVVARY
ncbi:hypothetical protein CBR_g48689 [Chara braunii]|uniref:4-hydroxy-tetrahydrodipicolinate synthase n=1 Tax=Chara braunii TaxID=69332 RepID=A0A388K4H0_CHABU|nr:hypothetical protein CBR_g48689 [Chara braunii]|eukprot:GBG64941.1 hypothetical protein CBR_g48689 [Chara braunii]